MYPDYKTRHRQHNNRRKIIPVRKKFMNSPVRRLETAPVYTLQETTEGNWSWCTFTKSNGWKGQLNRKRFIYNVNKSNVLR